MGEPTGVASQTRTRPSAEPVPTQRVWVNVQKKDKTPLGIPADGYTQRVLMYSAIASI